MNEKLVMVNNYKGVDWVLKVIYRVAKAKGKYNVYKEMMDKITKMHNVRPWEVINEYANKIGVIIYAGDMPNKSKKPIITGIIGSGKFWKEKYGLSGLDDDKRYLYNGENLIKLD